MAIAIDVHSLAPGSLIELFDLDLTQHGGGVLHFHAGTNGVRSPIVWGGVTYQAMPIEASGFEISGTGSLPRPKLKISNIGGLITSYLQQYQGLLGARIIRRRTMAKYLDAVNFPSSTNPTADAEQELPQEIWAIDRKSAENRIAVEFELASPIDVAGVKLPGRTIIANLCTWRTRRWNASSGTFDYSRVQCPYVGTVYYDISGNVVANPANEAFSKRVDTCCKLRFGVNSPLPFGGFPAAGVLI